MRDHYLEPVDALRSLEITLPKTLFGLRAARYIQGLLQQFNVGAEGLQFWDQTPELEPRRPRPPLVEQSKPGVRELPLPKRRTHPQNWKGTVLGGLPL